MADLVGKKIKAKKITVNGYFLFNPTTGKINKISLAGVISLF